MAERLKTAGAREETQCCEQTGQTDRQEGARRATGQGEAQEAALPQRKKGTCQEGTALRLPSEFAHSLPPNWLWLLFQMFHSSSSPFFSPPRKILPSSFAFLGPPELLVILERVFFRGTGESSPERGENVLGRAGEFLRPKS